MISILRLFLTEGIKTEQLRKRVGQKVRTIIQKPKKIMFLLQIQIM